MEYEDRREISTPEGVQLALPLAHLGSRFVAISIDLLVGGVALAIAILALLAAGGGLAASFAAATGLLVFYIGYQDVFEVLGGGRTLGKRAVGLRVVTDGGTAVGLRASLIRNVLLLVEGLPTSYVPAVISVLATRNNQRLGDLAAGTLVVREAKRATVAPPPLRAIEPERYSTWDVRGVGEVEAGAVRTFLERRAQLQPGARRALAQQLAQRVRPQVAGARPGLDDETFLEYFVAAKARGKLRESGE
jgi:uncharacterized RDD family membrane protein YckC